MVSTGDSFFDWIQQIVQGVSPFQAGTNFVVTLVIALIICIGISPRKPKNIITLLFPVMVGLTSIGLRVPLLFLVPGAIVFVMDVLSLNVIGGLIDTVGQSVSNVVTVTQERFGKVGRGQRELSWKKKEKEMRKLGMNPELYRGKSLKERYDKAKGKRVEARHTREEAAKNSFIPLYGAAYPVTQDTTGRQKRIDKIQGRSPRKRDIEAFKQAYRIMEEKRRFFGVEGE